MGSSIPEPRWGRRRSPCRRTRVTTRVRERGRAAFTLLGRGRARGALLPAPQGVRDTNSENPAGRAGLVQSGLLTQLVPDGDAERRHDSDVDADRPAHETLVVRLIAIFHACPAVKWRGEE